MTDYQIGDKGIILNEGSDFQAYIPYTKPNIGDKAYIYTMRNGMKIAIPVLEFELGNPMWISPDMPMAGFDWKVDFNFNLIPLGIPLPCVSTITAVGADYLEDNTKAWANDELIGKQVWMLSGPYRNQKFSITDNTETQYSISVLLVDGGFETGNLDGSGGGWQLAISGYTTDSVAEITTADKHSGLKSFHLHLPGPAPHHEFHEVAVFHQVSLTGASAVTLWYKNVGMGGVDSLFDGKVLFVGPNTVIDLPVTTTSGWTPMTITLTDAMKQASQIRIQYDIWWPETRSGDIYLDDIGVVGGAGLSGFAAGDRYIIWDPVEAKPYCGYAARLTGVESSYIEDAYRSWSTDELADYQIEMLTGPNGGSRFNITSNTRTKITLSSTAGFEIGNWYKIWDPVNSCYIPIG